MALPHGPSEGLLKTLQKVLLLAGLLGRCQALSHDGGRPWLAVDRTLVVLLGLIVSCGPKSPSSPAAANPASTSCLITIDTLRADAVGASGQSAGVTPWIDRLASAGVRFSHAYAHNVVTLPSHANILSGRLPPEHGVRDNAGFRFPPSLDTLATILKARGYRTGAFVSAFPLDSRFGLARGFDEYDDRFADAARPAFLVQERSGPETVASAKRWMDSRDGRPVVLLGAPLRAALSRTRRPPADCRLDSGAAITETSPRPTRRCSRCSIRSSRLAATAGRSSC